MSGLLVGQVLRYAQDLTGTKLIMLITLADCADDDGENCYPSMATLAARSRISERQAYRVVSDLIVDGYVEMVEHGRKGRNNRYRLLIPSSYPATESPKSGDDIPQPDTQMSSCHTCQDDTIMSGHPDTQMSYDSSSTRPNIFIGEEDFTGTERAALHILAMTEGYKFHWQRDLPFVRELIVDYPTINTVSALRDARTWLLDHPGKVKNFRLFYRHWLEKAERILQHPGQLGARC